MKKLLFAAFIFTTLSALLYLPVGADQNGEVTADVTPLVLSATIVGPTSVDYGALPLSLADDTRSQAVSGTLSVKNTGSVMANLMIRGADAGNGSDTDWTLDCTDPDRGVVGANQFAHRFMTAPLNDANAKALCSNQDKLLAANVAVDGMTDFELQMNMPTDSSGYGTRSTTVTVVAVQ